MTLYVEVTEGQQEDDLFTIRDSNRPEKPWGHVYGYQEAKRTTAIMNSLAVVPDENIHQGMLDHMLEAA